ncbi:hypothetical protein LIER_21003 [Lithospermum erythrorhizon]|uniref:Uncharacterized protein n=1 Tax=Lithospermum erythrorhizon TaxID=34254 RepID=A0AAV3QNP6_LITER
MTSLYVFLGSTLVSWSSKKQATVSRLSAEVENRVVSQSIAELEWLQALLVGLGLVFKSCHVVLCDTVSTTYMTANPVNHARSKHIEIDIYLVWESVAQGRHKSLSSNRFELLYSNRYWCSPIFD